MGFCSISGRQGISLGLGTVLMLVGCGTGAKYGVDSSTGVPLTGPVVSGYVHGGEQPITGAKISLYAAGTTGYGANATSLLNSAVTTDSTGAFSIVGLYTFRPRPRSYTLSRRAAMRERVTTTTRC